MMQCGKQIYSTKPEAIGALNCIRTRRKHTTKKEHSYYWCSGCSGYHLTSMQKEKSTMPKRNKQSSKVMRRRTTEDSQGHNSKYALKQHSKRQMYGPGCCGHSLTGGILKDLVSRKES